MKRKKICIILLVLLPVLLACGCLPEERIATLQSWIDMAKEASRQVDEYIVTTEAVIAEGERFLLDPSIDPALAATIRAQLVELKAHVEKAKFENARIADSITTWQEDINRLIKDGVNVFTELQIYGHGAQEASKYVPGQFGGLLYIGGGLLAAIASALGGSKLRQKKDDKVITNIVESVDKLVKAKTDTTIEEAIGILKDNQRFETRNEIRRIRKLMA